MEQNKSTTEKKLYTKKTRQNYVLPTILHKIQKIYILADNPKYGLTCYRQPIFLISLCVFVYSIF